MNIIESIVQENPKASIAGSSIIGTRQYQQDFLYLYSDSCQVFGIVCDGMGGLNGGETASRMAVELLARDYLRRDVEEPLPDFFYREAVAMDRAVSGLRDGNGNPMGAGTTVVAASIIGDQLYWLSVGDSKIYIIRNDEITAVTREHNYRLMLQEQLAAGRISQTEYDVEEKTRKAEALTSYIGMGGVKLADINQIPFSLLHGDLIVLCSDGVYKSLDESQIYSMVRDNDVDMAIAAERLTAMALEKGARGQDNTSVVLISFRERR